MFPQRILRCIFIASALAATTAPLSGCGFFRSAVDPAFAAYGTSSQDQEAKAFAPPPGKAAIYLYETKRVCNWIIGMRDGSVVRLDGSKYSDFHWNGYLWWLVEPGEHVIKVVCDLPEHPRPSGIDLSGVAFLYMLFDLLGMIQYPQCLPASIMVTAKNGDVVFVEHHLESYSFSQTKSVLQMVNVQQGREAIEKRRLVHDAASNSIDQFELEP